MTQSLAPHFTPDPAAGPEEVTALELASRLAGRLCHDMISPAGAIVSGLDLLQDPEAQDMREEAMALVTQSAGKLAALLTFARAAYGTFGGADSMDAREAERMAQDIFGHARAELDWAVQAESLPRAAARTALNMASLGATALPMGGTARLTGAVEDGLFRLRLEAMGARARLRPEALQGLNGEGFHEGLAGQWVQTYLIHAIVKDAGGRLQVSTAEDEVILTVDMPQA